MKLTLNNGLAEDTFCEREYDDLCAEVQATLICDPRAAVQSAVTSARMTRGENWLAEGRKLLQQLGLLTDPELPMRVSVVNTAPRRRRPSGFLGDHFDQNDRA